METLKKPGTQKPKPASEDEAFEALKESVDIYRDKLQQQGDTHPYVMYQPLFLTEEILSQWPDSPTAQTYLKAYRLFKKGLDILYNSKFTDSAGVTYLAQGIYTENTIRHCFADQLQANERFFVNLLVLIENTIANNATFFEGLAILPLLSGEKVLDIKSTLRDLERMSAIKNVILLIEQREPDSPILCDVSIECPGRYSGWLTYLYEYLASLYTVHFAFDQGFEAFENAVKLCPRNHDAKLGMAYCLMNIAVEKKVDELEDPVFNQLNEASKARKGDPKYQFDEKDRFEDVGATREKARELFIEYLREAPKCAKKYPNGHYHLAYLYMSEQNAPKFVEMYELAQKAEEKRLPFLPPVDTEMKYLLMAPYALCTRLQTPLQTPLQSASKCHYKECTKKTSERARKKCRCMKASYCDR